MGALKVITNTYNFLRLFKMVIEDSIEKECVHIKVRKPTRLRYSRDRETLLSIPVLYSWLKVSSFSQKPVSLSSRRSQVDRHMLRVVRITLYCTFNFSTADLADYLPIAESESKRIE